MLGLGVILLYIAATFFFREPEGLAAVVNETSQQIEILVVSDQPLRDGVLVMTLEPGGSLTLSGQLFADCTAESLVARGAADEEIERREPGLCEGDLWRVNGDPDD